MGVLNYDLDKLDTTQQFALGAVTQRDELGRVFKYFEYNDGDGDVDGVAGQLVVGLDSAYPPYNATMDYSSAAVPALAAVVEGFLQAALTHGTFGWGQCWGPNRLAMLTDGGVAQGDELMKHAATDGGVDTHTGDPAIIGVALEDDTGTALTAGQAFIKIDSGN